MKDYYDLITNAVALLRKNQKKSFNVRSISENTKEDYLFLVCDTDDGIVTSENAFIVFKVKIPFSDFSSTRIPLDDEAGVPNQDNYGDNAHLVRISYRIFKAYKAAVKKL